MLMAEDHAVMGMWNIVDIRDIQIIDGDQKKEPSHYGGDTLKKFLNGNRIPRVTTAEPDMEWPFRALNPPRKYFVPPKI